MHNLLVYGIENQSKNNMDRIELLLNIVVRNNLIIKIKVILIIKIKIKIRIKVIIKIIYNHIIIVFKIVKILVIVKVIIKVFHINQKPKNQQFLHLLHPQHQPQQHYLTTNL